MKQVISYIRVSTQRQGASGLGLDAQRAAVEEFCRVNDCQLIAEYCEIESGRKNDRPVLQKALAHARRLKATLLIGKLDRLARNVAFIANLMEANVEFRACDIPDASRFILHVMAAVGEQEARAISERTKAALQAAKLRGVLLGAQNPNCRSLTTEARTRGAQRMARTAADFNAQFVDRMRSLRKEGFSLQRIAEALNIEGFATRSGADWSVMQVKRVLDRANAPR